MLTDEILTALLEKQITFTKFAKDVQRDIENLAGCMMRKYRGSITTVDIDDLIQVMLLSIHRHLPNYDPARGSIRTYILFMMSCDARHELRHALPVFSNDSLGFHSMLIAHGLPQQPVQEQYCFARELRELLSTTDRSRAILDSLSRTCSLDKSTSELLARPETHIMFSSRPDRARRGLYRSACRLAKQAEAIA